MIEDKFPLDNEDISKILHILIGGILLLGIVLTLLKL